MPRLGVWFPPLRLSRTRKSRIGETDSRWGCPIISRTAITSGLCGSDVSTSSTLEPTKSRHTIAAGDSSFRSSSLSGVIGPRQTFSKCNVDKGGRALLGLAAVRFPRGAFRYACNRLMAACRFDRISGDSWALPGRCFLATYAQVV